MSIVRVSQLVLGGLLTMSLSHCGSDKSGAAGGEGEALESGCRMSKAVDVGTNELVQGDKELVLNKIVLDKTPTGWTADDVAKSKVRLYQLFFERADNTLQPSGSLAGRIEIQRDYYGIANVMGGIIGSISTGNRNQNGTRTYSLTLGQGATAETVTVKVKDNVIQAIELKNPVRINGTTQTETLCVKEASVEKPF